MNKHIQKVTRKIKDRFAEYNESFPDETYYTIDSPEVTNKESGQFWLNAESNIQVLIQNRCVIDAWCQLKRAEEEKDLLIRDATLYKQHLQSDIKTLRSDRIFAEALSINERIQLGFMIERRIRVLNEEYHNVEYIL